LTIATDYERYRNVRDSFDNYHHKLDLAEVNS